MYNPSERRAALARRVLVTISVLTSLSLFACKKEEGLDKAETPPTVAVSQAPAPQAVAQKKPDPKVEPEVPPPDLFERGPAVSFELGAELIKAPPQKFSRSDLAKKKLLVANYRPGRKLWLAVDHHAPRLAKQGQFTVSDLINEDVELAPGSHYLVAFEWDGEGPQPLQLAAFFVDVEPVSLPRTPGCIIVTPHLTRNGALAEQPLRLLAVPLMKGIDQVEYRARGAGLNSAGRESVGTEILLPNPPAGDIELSARCFSGSELLAEDEQIVTSNPEALDPELRP